MATETYLAKLATKNPELLARRQVDQCGAACWRIGADQSIEVLLVTSRDTGRWVIPKGNIEKKEQLHHCARREALEEAGVRGRVCKKSIGYFTYLKDAEKPPFTVSVFPLQVEVEADVFRERDQRRRVWFPITEAGHYVEEPELQGIFRLMGSGSGPKFFRNAVRKATQDPIAPASLILSTQHAVLN